MAKPPCYVAAVHNLRPVANCVAQSLSFLRNSGLRIDRTTCVGHSLGAHLCGNLSKFLNFRLEKIIGLDPARPLIKAGNRLDRGHAKAVQVVHTNAGRYGEGGRIGHVDFCINGGRRQPYCSGTSSGSLCDFVYSINCQDIHKPTFPLQTRISAVTCGPFATWPNRCSTSPATRLSPARESVRRVR